MSTDMAWAGDALCAEVGGDIHFPEKGEPTAPAKRVCMACEVRHECGEYAITRNERFGIWGGMSERQRREERSRRRREARAA